VRLTRWARRRTSELLVEALFVRADVRVLRRLDELAALYGARAPGTVVPLTQDDIAGLAGTSRATVNRVLREEAARGTIELGRGKTVVLDPAALVRRAGMPRMQA
jgi:CRP-like cAMP-binding protein